MGHWWLGISIASHDWSSVGFNRKITELNNVSYIAMFDSTRGYISLNFPWKTHHFPMVFLWLIPFKISLSHHFPMVFPRFSHGFPTFAMVFPWFCHVWWPDPHVCLPHHGAAATRSPHRQLRQITARKHGVNEDPLDDVGMENHRKMMV